MARIIVWMEPACPSHGLHSEDYCEAEDDDAKEYSPASSSMENDEDVRLRSGPSEVQVRPPKLQKPFKQVAYKPDC